MKKIFFLTLTFVSLSTFAQQSFAGYRNGYYAGTHSVLSNPASIAGSPRKWDVNLLSMNFNVGNDKIGYDLKRYKENIEKFSQKETYQNISAGIHLDVLTPSFTFALNKKHALAITTRTRASLMINNLDVQFLDAITTEASKRKQKLTPIKLENQALRLNVFSEIGATWAGIVFDKNGHIVKTGVTAKYVRGTANMYANIQDVSTILSTEANQKDVFLRNTTGELAAVNSGVSIKNFKAQDLLKSNASGFGFDLGAVYEYTPKYGEPYMFKVGMAITDIGSLKYSPIKDEAYNYKFVNADIKVSDNVQEELNQKSLAKKEITPYNVSLPTAIQANVDYHVGKGFFVELAGQFGMTKSKAQNPYYNNELTLTPRFERKAFGVYLPLTYSSLSKTNLGAVLRLGPLLLGSSSLITNLTSESKSTDIFIGLRFGR